MSASTTITFKSITGPGGEEVDSDGNLVKEIWIELDDVKNVDDSGNAKSRFNYGEMGYFRVYTNPPNLAYTLEATDGTVGDTDAGTIEKSTRVTFSESNEASVSFPIGKIKRYTWFGNSLGMITGGPGTKVIASNSGKGVATVYYDTTYNGHSISVSTRIDPETGQPYVEYPIVIFVTITG